MVGVLKAGLSKLLSEIVVVRDKPSHIRLPRGEMGGNLRPGKRRRCYMGKDTAAVKGSRSFVLFIFRFGKQNAANAVKVTY